MRRRDRSRGQALVEFALILPIFVLLLVGMFDLGHVVWANDALATAAREAARFAVVHGGSDRSTCPQGPLPATYGGTVGTSTQCGFAPSSRTPYVDSRTGVKAQATRWLNGVGTSTISVCYGQVTTCTNDVDASGATNIDGTKVTVTVRSTVSLAAPSILGLGRISLSGTATMLVNN